MRRLRTRVQKTLLAVLIGTISLARAEVVVYDFTGVVTHSTWDEIEIGSLVSGSFAVDLDGKLFHKNENTWEYLALKDAWVEAKGFRFVSSANPYLVQVTKGPLRDGVGFTNLPGTLLDGIGDLDLSLSGVNILKDASLENASRLADLPFEEKRFGLTVVGPKNQFDYWGDITSISQRTP